MGHLWHDTLSGFLRVIKKVLLRIGWNLALGYFLALKTLKHKKNRLKIKRTRVMALGVLKTIGYVYGSYLKTEAKNPSKFGKYMQKHLLYLKNKKKISQIEACTRKWHLCKLAHCQNFQLRGIQKVLLRIAPNYVLGLLLT